jgi:hypothetical protein
MANLFTYKVTSIPKNALISTFLVANAFVWYLCIFKFLQNAAGPPSAVLEVVTLNIVSLVIFAFIGVFFIDKFKKRLAFLRFWISIGIFLSFLIPILNFGNNAMLMIIAGGVGVYFGLGMPICMGHFTANTATENRGKLSALIILSIGLLFPLFSSMGDRAFVAAGSLAIWQLLGLICIVALKPPEQRAEQKDKVSYSSVISNKAFLLYLLPWFMFSLINDLTKPLNNIHFGGNYSLVEMILSGVAAVVFGFLVDRKGRKRLALIGFVLLGLGYASIGLFGVGVVSSSFFVITDGIAWGAFSMLFLFTIWGDIAQGKNGEKYYVLGVLPYLFSNFTRLSLGTYIAANNVILESSVFSFASFFLFAAVLPLAYAPETLSDRIIRDLDINSYVHKALEKVKKENMKRETVS